MISKEQMDTLIGRLKVYGSESGRGKDHPNAIACRTAASVIIEQQAEIERLRDGYNAGVQDAAMIMQKRADQMMELGEDDMMVRYFGSAVQIQSLIKDEDQ